MPTFREQLNNKKCFALPSKPKTTTNAIRWSGKKVLLFKKLSKWISDFFQQVATITATKASTKFEEINQNVYQTNKEPQNFLEDCLEHTPMCTYVDVFYFILHNIKYLFWDSSKYLEWGSLRWGYITSPVADLYCKRKSK